MYNTPEVTVIGFDYFNASELEEIQRNLGLLYGTRAGTCPGDRSFGLDQAFESCPTNVAQNLFALEIIEKTEMYEKRVEILDISYEQSKDGNLNPKIIIGPRDADDADGDADSEDQDG